VLHMQSVASMFVTSHMFATFPDHWKVCPIKMPLSTFDSLLMLAQKA